MDFETLPETERNRGMPCFTLCPLQEKFSTLFVLSMFGAPICPCVNSCLFLFHCLNDCCSMFHVEKKKKWLKLYLLAIHLLIQSQFIQQRLIKVALHLSHESSTAG